MADPLDALREIAEFRGAPCSFDLCTRPGTLADCVPMQTCHVCWAVCIAADAIADEEGRPTVEEMSIEVQHRFDELRDDRPRDHLRRPCGCPVCVKVHAWGKPRIGPVARCGS